MGANFVKILVLGIDGLGQRSLRALRLTQLAELLQGGVQTRPNIDNVVSRGWPELYAGENAYQTGAFYVQPEFQRGTVRISKETGYSKVLQHVSASQLLWNRLSSQGQNVSVFALPTVGRLCGLSGFSVAGTGGGNFTNGLSESDFWPNGLYTASELNGVNLGLRLGFGGWLPRSTREFISGVEQHIKNYFTLLRRALDRRNTDHLILGTRFVGEMCYKFMSLLEDGSLKYSHASPEAQLRNAILALAARFQDYLLQFIKDYNADHLFVVSDHGITPLRWHVNLNAVLRDLSYVGGRNVISLRPLRFVYRKARAFALSEPMAPLSPSYGLGRSVAFSPGFTDLIYLGPKAASLSDRSREAVVSKLLFDLNGWLRSGATDAIQAFRAAPVSALSTPSSPMPTVRAVLREGAANTARYDAPSVDFSPTFGDIFQRGFFGEYSGTKSEDTVAAYIGCSQTSVDLSSLPSIYRTIADVAESK